MKKMKGEKRKSFHLQILGLVSAAILLVYLFHGRNQVVSKNTVYGLYFDAGSTGSRIHVYSFDGVTGKLLGEIFQEVKPGLSSFSDPKEAAKSLQPLIDEAVRSVPPKLHSCTPLALKATAGLRQLGGNKAEEILEEVRKFFKQYNFYMGDDAVAILDGSDEGVFAWITVNYLLGRLNHPSESTVSIMDLGGASTQIVFEPKGSALAAGPSTYKYKLKYGDKEYNLYQHSYEKYGLMRAREQILNSLNEGTTNPVPHPCVPEGHSETITLAGKKSVYVPSSPNFEKCTDLARKVLKKNAPCEASPCSFNGVFQPTIGDAEIFSGDMYAFSYFYDRTQLDSERHSLSLADIKEMGRKSCKSTAKDSAHGVLCTDLSYIYSLLHHGYGLTDSHSLKIAKKIDGYETAWTLGAMVTLLKNNKLTCSG